ncbi:hypothetical protein PV326_003728 [Microctonus aethiopoides]|nr:hypothetical protein PV326_003728 [Microctonus aethiopoides]
MSNNIWATFIVTVLCISLNRSAPQNSWVWPNEFHSTREKQINDKTKSIVSNSGRTDVDENENISGEHDDVNRKIIFWDPDNNSYVNFTSDTNNETLNTTNCRINEEHVTLNSRQSLYCDDYDQHKLKAYERGSCVCRAGYARTNVDTCILANQCIKTL